MTFRLSEALHAWGTPEFNAVLKREIAHLDAEQLPLQQGLTSSSYALDDRIEAVILAVAEEADCLRVKAGIFYAGIVAGCSCADDPTPIDENTEYCEVRLEIDKATAETTVTLLPG